MKSSASTEGQQNHALLFSPSTDTEWIYEKQLLCPKFTLKATDNAGHSANEVRWFFPHWHMLSWFWTQWVYQNVMQQFKFVQLKLFLLKPPVCKVFRGFTAGLHAKIMMWGIWFTSVVTKQRFLVLFRHELWRKSRHFHHLQILLLTLHVTENTLCLLVLLFLVLTMMCAQKKNMTKQTQMFSSHTMLLFVQMIPCSFQHCEKKAVPFGPICLNLASDCEWKTRFICLHHSMWWATQWMQKSRWWFAPTLFCFCLQCFQNAQWQMMTTKQTLLMWILKCGHFSQHWSNKSWVIQPLLLSPQNVLNRQQKKTGYDHANCAQLHFLLDCVSSNRNASWCVFGLKMWTKDWSSSSGKSVFLANTFNENITTWTTRSANQRDIEKLVCQWGKTWDLHANNSILTKLKWN